MTRRRWNERPVAYCTEIKNDDDDYYYYRLSFLIHTTIWWQGAEGIGIMDRLQVPSYDRNSVHEQRSKLARGDATHRLHEAICSYDRQLVAWKTDMSVFQATSPDPSRRRDDIIQTRQLDGQLGLRVELPAELPIELPRVNGPLDHC